MAVKRLTQISLGFFVALAVIVAGAPILGIDRATLVAAVVLLAMFIPIEAQLRMRSRQSGRQGAGGSREPETKADESLAPFLTEEPIERPEQDLFGRMPFAREMAAYVARAQLGTAGRVIAITAPWGAGKTSLLNLVAKELEGYPDWSVVRFNPWAVTGLEPLMRDFFRTLDAAFSDRDNYRELQRKLARYADAVSPWARAIKTPLVNPAEAFEALGQLLGAEHTVEDLHAAVSGLLGRSPKRTLLIIDDVDRLEPAELLLVFKLVRLVGNLPRLDYLLAFHERSVVEAIQATTQDVELARTYLDKVVPTRFAMPPAHAKYVDSLFNVYFSSWLSESSVQLYPDDASRLSAAYYAWMATRLAVPRNLKALFSEAGPPMALLRADANPVDVLLLVYVRHFIPSLFQGMQQWKFDLTRPVQIGAAGRLTRDQRAEFWRERLKSVGVPSEELQPALTFLAQLFLPLKGVVESWDAFLDETWRGLDRDRRVGSAHYFDRYFDQGLAPGEVSDMAIDAALVAIRSKANAGSEGLRDLLKNDPDRVLDRLFQLRSEVPVLDQLRLVVELAFTHADLPETSVFALSPKRRAEHWTADVIQEAAQEGIPIFEILEPLVASKDGFRLMLAAIDTALAARRSSGEQVPVPLERLRVIVLANLKTELEAIRQQLLTAGDDTLGFLYSWSRIDSRDSMRAWVAEQLLSGAWNLLDLAALCVPIAVSYSQGSSPRQVLGDFQAELLDGLVDWQQARTMLGPILELADKTVDSRDPSFENRREIAATALRRRLSEESAKRQPGSYFTRELLAANAKPYMTIVVDAVPSDPRELSEHALDIGDVLANRLNKDAIAQSATGSAAWWQVGAGGGPDWIFWIYPGPTLVVRAVAPVKRHDGQAAFSMTEIVSWWKRHMRDLGSAMKELGTAEVRVGISLQSLPSGSDPITDLDFGSIPNPGRRARPPQVIPWSQVLEPAAAGRVPEDFEAALRALVKQFQYRGVEVSARALARIE
jgi:hypothetical protein